MRRLLLPLLIAALAALAGLPGAAQASRSQESILTDFEDLIKGTDKEARLAVKRARDIGFSRLRVSLNWHRVAPGAGHPVGPPVGFNPTHPASYGAAAWRPYDRAVRLATANGLEVYMNVVGFAPRWATPGEREGRLDYIFKMDPVAWGRFVQAVGTRYSGRYPAEDGSGTLPRVNVWALANEPNQGGWTAPQFEASEALGGRVIPNSPHQYREQLHRGWEGLQASGHANDIVLIGELAPSGRENREIQSPMRPLLFLRELFCLDDRYQPLVGIEAEARGCANFKPLPGTAFGIHPYGLALRPGDPAFHPDDVSLATLDRLGRVLDRAAALGRLAKKDMPIWNTEFGWQTKPDPIVGISPELHADFMMEAEYVNWRNRRVRTFGQFLLRDDPRRTSEPDLRRSWAGWQSGLYYFDGKPKPAAWAMVMPIHPVGGPGRFRVWGMVRPGFKTERRVQLQHRPLDPEPGALNGGPGAVSATDGYDNVGRPFMVRGRGYFERPTAFRTGYWRFVWHNPQAGPLASRSVLVPSPSVPAETARKAAF